MLGQCFPARLGSRVEVRYFSERDGSVSLADTFIITIFPSSPSAHTQANKQTKKKKNLLGRSVENRTALNIVKRQSTQPSLRGNKYILIPNGKVVLIPFESDLQIMVFRDQRQNCFSVNHRFLMKKAEASVLTVSLEYLTLSLRNALDIARVDLMPNSEQRFPRRYRVRSYKRATELLCY